jgi:hypothetical protein
MRPMRTFAWLLPFALLGASACSSPPPPPPPFQTTVNMKDLMLNVLDPAADGVWDAVGTVATIEGVFEKFPATDDEWAGVRGYAIQLAESGNLLMLPSRSSGSAEWIADAQALIAQSQRALKAIDAKDKDALFTIGGDIYDVCTSCHGKFIVTTPPPASTPVKP